MTDPPEESLLADIEASAIQAARGAGELLRGYFGSSLDVEYKDRKRLDPVTSADRECQRFLIDSISNSYPDHGIVAEEDSTGEQDRPAPDYVWVLDPLDGTTNFLNGFPLFACSIGVLYRGTPVVGALYLPWPGEKDGMVAHARMGAGAYLDEERLSVFRGPEPEGNRLVGLPASLEASFHRTGPASLRAGETRVTGSIAYELAMVARGVLQYAVISGARLWDVAGGAALIVEAGGEVMSYEGVRRRPALAGTPSRWVHQDAFLSPWQPGVTTLKDLHGWSSPLIVGSPEVTGRVTQGLRGRKRLRRRLLGVLRRRA